MRNLRIIFFLAIVVALLSLAMRTYATDSQNAREVAFQNGSVTLQGTLLVPKHPGPHPAIIFLHGSGPQTREFAMPHAERFARLGIASLVFDKRGSGASSGDWTTSSLDDLARDAVAGIEFLKTQKEIDRHQVGIWGISQAGWVSALASSLTDEIAFLIMVTGGGATPLETEMYAYKTTLRHAELSAKDQSEALDLLHLYFEYLRTGENRNDLLKAIQASKAKKWSSIMPLERVLPSEAHVEKWRWVATFDPAPYIAEMKFPVLILLAEKDEFTPTELASRKWEENLRKAGNRDYEIKIFKGANHGIRLGAHHSAAESTFADGYWETMENWLQKHLK